MTRGLFHSRIERRFLRFRRTGDPAALAAVFDAAAPQVLRVAMHLSRDPAAAEDVVQRTFLTAIESAASFDGSRRLLPWLLGIASNHAKEAARKAARAPDPERLPRREAVSPEDAAQAAEALSAAGEALDALPDPARSILVLRFRHGLEPAEIADALGLSPSTVRSHLHRGTERLRRGLPRGLVLPAAFLATPPRGLAQVRRVVLDRAKEAGPALAAAAAGAVAVPLVIGGIVVNKTLVAAAAAVLCLLGGGLWVGSTLSGAPASGSGAPPAAPAPAVPPTLARAERPPPRDVVPATGAPAATGGILDVGVTDSDGAPAARVGILVGPGENGVHVVKRTVTTDAEGRARIEGLAAGKVLLSLTSGGKYVDVPAEGTLLVEVRLARGVTIEGEVVDEGDRPVPRAEVWVERDSSRWQRVFKATTADERGRFRIRDVERWASLAARSEGRAPSLTRRVLGSEGETEHVRLALGGPAGQVRGRVRGPNGVAVPGAFVLVGSGYGVQATLPDGTQGNVALPLVARSGDDGTFVAGDWPAGVTTATVRARGYAGVRTVLEVLPHPAVTEWVVDLEPGVVVEGTVTGPDGRPAEGAVVRSDGYVEASWQWRTTAGPDGRYRIEDLPVLTEKSFGFRADAADDTASAWFGVGAVRTGETVRRDVELRRPDRLGIDVRVVSESGAGLEGFHVGAFGSQSHGIQEKAGAKTDARGRARIEGLDAEAYRLEAVDPVGDPWMPCAAVDDVTPGDPVATIRVLDAARPRGRLVGKVVAAGGEIPIGARAWVFPRGRRHGLNLTLDRATGRVESAALPPGGYELTVDAPGYGAAKFGWKTLSGAEDLDLGTLRLETPGRLLVHCRGAQKAVAVGMNLSADAGNGLVWGRMRPDGTTPFEVMQPGRYRVRMAGGIWGAPAAAWATVESGKKTEIEMTIVPGFSRRFRVEAERPEDLVDVRVRARERAEDEPAEERLIPLVRDGAVEGDLTLAPGTWLFEATSGTGLRAEAVVEVRGDGEPPVVLRLSK